MTISGRCCHEVPGVESGQLRGSLHARLEFEPVPQSDPVRSERNPSRNGDRVQFHTNNTGEQMNTGSNSYNSKARALLEL